MTVATGIISALLAPLLEAVGFLEWDIQWTNSGGSAFALNLYKCNLAAFAFFFMSFVLDGRGPYSRRLSFQAPNNFANQYETDYQLLNQQIHADLHFQQHLAEQHLQDQFQIPQLQHYHEPHYTRNSRMDAFPAYVIFYLMLSSFLGIVIGDLAELEALRLVGARRVLVVDTIKPFAAAFLGHFLLDEIIHPSAVIGMAMTVAGVYVVLMATVQTEKDHSPVDTIMTIEQQADEEWEERGEKKENNMLLRRPLSKHNLSSLITESDDDNSFSSEEEVDNFSMLSSTYSEQSGASSNEDFFIDNIPSPSKSSDETGELIVSSALHTDSSIRFSSSPSKSGSITSGSSLLSGSIRSRLSSFASSSSFMSTESECGPPPGYYGSQNQRERRRDRKFRLRKGYCLALLNVLLDAYGSLLTKRYAVNLNTWEIGFVRYGFAGFVLALVSVGLRVRDNMLKHSSSITKNRDWYRLPTMEIQPWITVSLGVVFVTFLCPALTNYALFEIALALAVTLNSTTPLYMLPLMWLVKKEKPTRQGSVGALLACVGVVILCIWGIDAANYA